MCFIRKALGLARCFPGLTEGEGTLLLKSFYKFVPMVEILRRWTINGIEHSRRLGLVLSEMERCMTIHQSRTVYAANTKTVLPHSATFMLQYGGSGRSRTLSLR